MTKSSPRLPSFPFRAIALFGTRVAFMSTQSQRLSFCGLVTEGQIMLYFATLGALLVLVDSIHAWESSST